MDAARIQARAVVKVAAISLAVIAVAAAAGDRRAPHPDRAQLALRRPVPRAGHQPGGRPAREPPPARPPRFPSLARDPGSSTDPPSGAVRLPGAPGGPADHQASSSTSARRSRATSQDFRQWANQNQQFQDLNHKYDITRDAQRARRRRSPPSSAPRPSDIQNVTVSVLEHLLAAITILALTFFLLLDGRQQGERLLERFDADAATRLAANRGADRRGGQVLRHR